MKEIGGYLRGLRVNHGVSVEEAASDLNVSKDDISNLEDGITRAFKDIFILRDLVNEYAKYLGADTDKVNDEFNDFMFEKTSKISLDDIKQIRKEENKKEEEKKVYSPYTKIPPRKTNYKPLIACICITIAVLALIYWIFMVVTEEPPRTEELRIEKEGMISYEYTY